MDDDYDDVVDVDANMMMSTAIIMMFITICFNFIITQTITMSINTIQ